MASLKGTAQLRGAKSLQKRLKAIQTLPAAIAKDPRISGAIVERTKRRFVTKKAPDGRRWKALSRYTHFPRRNPNRADILVDTGALRDSIGVTGRFGYATNLGFRIGSLDRRQAGKVATHQRGGVSPITHGPIPARPFLGISKEDLTIVERISRQIIRERVKNG